MLHECMGLFISCTSDETQTIAKQSLPLDNFKETWEEFNKIQDEIEILDSAPELETENVNERLEFENSYFETIARAKQLLNSIQQSSSVKQETLASELPHSVRVKLPQIDAPNFSGKYEDWISFKELFTAVIDKNPDIDEVHKLYYLRQSLKGESAAKLIDSIALTEQNYKSAWELLTKRFQNQRLIIERHIKALFDYPKLDKDSSFAIRQMIDETNIHIRALKSLKQPTDTWNTMLVYLLPTKLDYNSVKEWKIHSPHNRVATFAEFLEFLDKRAKR
ncbi:uncharacterized protein LOC142322583 [Lycorma delicatula]|uniref:uncharacterized protein LOC142322583 n=1 Tax=Lycorma delicatula TaxID=130591 RepID=UPI003F515B6E